MPFTTTYAIVNLDDDVGFPLSIPFPTIKIGAAQSNGDIIGLSNGGIAGIGDFNGSTLGTVFDPVGKLLRSYGPNAGTNGSIAQLTNGNLAILSQDSDSLRFKIVNSVTGTDVLASVDVGRLNASNADVTALAGNGFCFAYTEDFGGGDTDIEIDFRNAQGVSVGLVSVDASTASDNGASIARLDNGNVAVGWTRTIGSQTEVWYAVYTAAGSVVKSATLLDTAGAINRNVSLASTAAGFAIAYEDNQYAVTGLNITVATLNANGTGATSFNATGTQGSGQSNPALTRLDNGLLALAYSNFQAANNLNTFWALIDPVARTTLATRDVFATSGDNNCINPSVAGFGDGRILVIENDTALGSVSGQSFLVARTSTGDQFSINTFTGDSFVDIVIGGDFNDTLNGDGGNDSLQGGSGADTLNGDAGNDLLEGGFSSDTINGGAGNDTIYGVTKEGINGSGAPDFISGGEGNDSITGSAGSDTLSGDNGNDSINGDEGFDTLTGGAGNDRLDGGSSNDQMNGGTGNDIYLVDDAFDATAELLNEGFDRIVSSLSWTLRAHTERLDLSGLSNLNGTGNELANTLVGNSGRNVLSGLVGNDLLFGGGGNDILSGGTQNDTLYGDLGNDTLTGGAGVDSFVFRTALSVTTNLDRITDFSVADDTIRLENAVFTALPAVGLAATAFKTIGVPGAVIDSSDRIIYDRGSGKLLYDANGSGPGGQVQFATLAANLALTHLDFIVF